MLPSLIRCHWFCLLVAICHSARGDTPVIPTPGLPRHSLIRSDVPSRVVRLQATCKYTNNSTTDVQKLVHRVTVPPTDLDYQILISISGDGIENAQMKEHKNGLDSYLEFSFPILAQKTLNHRVAYTVLLIPIDYLKPPPHLPHAFVVADADKAYLAPSPLIESDSQPIKDVADAIVKKTRDRFKQIRLAYEYPAKHLTFKPQPPAGAVSALRTGIGDCTEYSALFAALCRALGIPARQTGVFHFRKDRETYESPNHNSAEVYLGKAGWVPVDPNIGGGKYDRDYGLARMGNSVIVLVREGAWVWGNWLPPDGYDNSKAKPKVSAEMKWETDVIEQGNAVSLYRKFVQPKAQSSSSAQRR